MPSRLPEFVLNQILTLHAAGWSAKDIHKALNLGRGTIYQLLKNLNEHGEFYPCAGARIGRQRLLNDEAEEVSDGSMRMEVANSMVSTCSSTSPAGRAHTSMNFKT